MLIDSHCHIDFPVFDATRSQLLAQCQQLGMGGIMVPGVTRAQWDEMDAVIGQHDAPELRLWRAYGLHPCFMDQHQLTDLEALDARLSQGAIAVGEIGLDAFHGTETLAQQQALFEAQLALAKQYDLPIIVHARKTQDQVMKAVRAIGLQTGGVMHAFSGSLQQAQAAVAQGFCIGFGGAATYERASRLRAILQALPEDAIVFETDSPDIPPAFARERPNSPENLFRIVEILASVRGEDPAQAWAYSTQNLVRVFNLRR